MTLILKKPALLAKSRQHLGQNMVRYFHPLGGRAHAFKKSYFIAFIGEHRCFKDLSHFLGRILFFSRKKWGFFPKNRIKILKKNRFSRKIYIGKSEKIFEKNRIFIWKNEPLKCHHKITGRPSQNASKTFGNRLEIFLWYLEPA